MSLVIIYTESRGSKRKEPEYINSRGNITLKTWNVIKDS